MIDIQNAFGKRLPFSYKKIRMWASLPLTLKDSPEITIRFVTNAEIQDLNHRYRKKNKPTNVLAFPNTATALSPSFLGDIVIAPAVLYQEHQALHVSLEAHWAHILIHGILHLLGYNHENEEETKVMQQLEIAFLAQLHHPNPYRMV